MRFHENGPNIPDDLITAQIQGEVVFFCGAGVSVPARLPNFQELARHVMHKFGVSKISNETLGTQLEQIEAAIESHGAVKLPFSLDQTFYFLQQEYGKVAVAQEVLAAVKTPKHAPVDGHKDILRLARTSDGCTQIVTTNFDLLFEKADARVRSYVPPALPALGNGEQLDGVVYLHGKWVATSSQLAANNLIISSADFGRAYLADGWASTFIKDLAQQKTIVLIGYSAEDPPVRYLLEGLHARGVITKPRIYSFERGSPEAVNQNWQHRGVTGIAYSQHDSLWTSLNAWASYAETPDEWLNAVITMAQCPPSDLKPHERGQVAFAISTPSGAKRFSYAEPPPPAEWLCVFDPKVRNRKPLIPGAHLGIAEVYSSQDRFALDDDIYLAEDSDEVNVVGTDYLSELSSDEHRRSLVSLTTSQAPLPARLQYIAYWLTRVLHQPTSLWWLADKHKISNQLKGMIEYKLRRSSPSDISNLEAWWSYFEQGDLEAPHFDHRLYRFNDMVKVHGWNARMLRALEDALKPLTDVRRYSAVPPENEVKAVVIKVQLPQMSGISIDIPDTQLVDVIRIYRTCIERLVAVESSSPYAFYPDILGSAANQLRPEIYSYVQWFKTLYSRLAAHAPEKARTEANSWSVNDINIFAPLRIHAWRHQPLWKPHEVIDGIFKLPEQYLWRNKQYIAPLIGTFWSQLTVHYKETVLEKVRKGPSEKSGLLPTVLGADRALFISPFLLALQTAGCVLDSPSTDIIEAAESNPKWMYAPEEKFSSPSGVIRRSVDTNPEQLLAIPVSEIVEMAEYIKASEQFTGNLLEPFEGLVKENATRGYRALVLAGRRGQYPSDFWRDILRTLPEGSSNRLCLAIVERVLRMPSVAFDEICMHFCIYLERLLPQIAVTNWKKATAIWDLAFERFIVVNLPGLEAQRSGQNGFQRHPQGSPLSRLLRLLSMLYSEDVLTHDRNSKGQLQRQLNRAFFASDASRQLVINNGIANLDWYHRYIPTWTKEHLVQCLKEGHRDNEAAWHGFMSLSVVMPPSIFHAVKDEFLEVFGKLSQWQWGKNLSGALHGHFLQYCNQKGREGRFLNDVEARQILQRTEDNGRVFVLNRLNDGGNWKTFQKRFLRDIWPRELKYRNTRISSSLVRIALENEENFAEAVTVIMPLMTPISHADVDFYSLKGSIQRLGASHPTELLSFIAAAIDDSTYVGTDEISKILDVIEQHAPPLRTAPKMKWLREYLTRNPS